MNYVIDYSPWFLRAVAFVFGAVWGSFFNVAIYRWPREMSVVSPSSKCTHCGTPISAFRNIPIFGYLMLKGKTACCGQELSSRYAIVEFITGVLCVAVVEQFVVQTGPGTELFPASMEALLYFFFVGGLLIATFVDLEFMEIPDEVSLGGAALGLATITLRHDPGPTSAALGAGLGFLSIQVFFVWGYENLFGKRGMGEGDSKFLMFIGAFLGWKGAMFALVGGAMQGVVAYGVLRVLGKDTMPDLDAADARREFAFGERIFSESTEEPVSPGRAQQESEDPEPSGSANQESAPSENDAHAPSDEHVANSERDASNEHAAQDEQGDGDLPSGPMMPYGPMLAVAAIEYLFFGDEIVTFYLSLIRPS